MKPDAMSEVKPRVIPPHGHTIPEDLKGGLIFAGALAAPRSAAEAQPGQLLSVFEKIHGVSTPRTLRAQAHQSICSES